MPWIVGGKNHLNQIVSYLLENEAESVQALSLFINNGIYRFPRTHSVITIIKIENKIISGLITITSKGLIYPRFSKLSRSSEDEKRHLIKLIATINVRIHGVIGLEEDVKFLDSIIFRRIKGKNSYLLLQRESKELFNIQDNYIIKQASIFDLNRLCPLEIEYQKEEVLLSPSDLNRSATIENFRNKILQNSIYFLSDNKFPLSKCGTSYRSKNYTLIGGVFTWKEKRNMGLSTLLLKYLLNDQLQKGFKAALFVKDSNKIALHIYKKLGFINPQKYIINYYHL